jgi:hypothetical protein
MSTDEQMTDTPVATQDEAVLMRDMELVAVAANQLAATSKPIVEILNSMIILRQLHTLVLQELDHLFDSEEFSTLKLPEALNQPATEIPLTADRKAKLKEVFVNAAAMKAQDEFEIRRVLFGTDAVLLPKLKEIATRMITAGENQRRSEAEAAEKARIETAITFDHIHGCVFKRDRPLLFVGAKQDLQLVLDQLTRDLLVDHQSFQAVRLGCTAPVASDPRLVTVPQDAWKHVCESGKAFQRLYETVIGSQLTNPVDVLIVDDLRLTVQAPDFFSSESVANKSQHRLAKWCREAGCLLVGAAVLREGETLTDNSPLFEHNNVFVIERSPSYKLPDESIVCDLLLNGKLCVVSQLPVIATSKIIVPDSTVEVC